MTQPLSERLTDSAMFEGTAPAAFAPVLALLAELEAVTLDEATPLEARRPRARAVRTQLLAAAAGLAGTTPPALSAQSPEHARWFTEAVLLWTHYADAGGRVLLDTMVSGTLARFRPDLVATPADRRRIRDGLARAFAWPEAELAAIERAVESRISNLRVKNAIAAHLARSLDGAPGSARLQQQILALFQRFHGPLPLRPGDVDVTLTSTTLLFGLPFAHGILLRPDFDQRPADERAAVAAFLALVDKAKNSFDTLRFPGFGYYDRGRLDPALLPEMTAAVEAHLGGVPERVVAETLATMVSLVPSQEADLFLIHDIWGHGWEESLCEFEWSYTRLVELREPVGPGSGPRFGGDQALAAAFVVQDGRVVLDAAALERALLGDLRGRITIGLNVVVAECLADLVEHKYERRRAPTDPPLPSTSLFPEAPQKLDLSLRDVQTLLKAAHRPYRRLLAEPAEQHKLTAALAATGLPEAGLPEAVAQAVALLRERWGHLLETAMRPPQPAGEGLVKVNLAERVMLGMVALAAEVGAFLDAADADGPAGPRASIDLLVLVLGWFYEQDRRLHFWHLDELLRAELRPTFDRFERALTAGAPPG
jgi:hypothetical protein